MLDKSQTDRLKEIRDKVRKEFDLFADEFYKQNTSGRQGRLAFISLARADGFKNPQIAEFLETSANAVSQSFANATKQRAGDYSFDKSVKGLAADLKIDLS
jgi:hypothetical protein